MRIKLICYIVENRIFQIRKIQMSERSTLVDINVPGGLTFVYNDFRTAIE